MKIDSVKDELKEMILKHYQATGSQAARDVLKIFDTRVAELLDTVNIKDSSEMTPEKTLSVLIS